MLTSSLLSKWNAPMLVTLLMMTILTSCAFSKQAERCQDDCEPTNCIPSGSHEDIQRYLTEIGSKAVLCQGAVFELTAPVRFTKEEQQIYTEGFPTDQSRAVLRLAHRNVATAIDGEDISDIQIRNLIIDGNRPTLGAVSEGSIPHPNALISLGGIASGQVVEHVKAFEPRHWTILHLFEGHGLRCSGALVRFNDFGPAGEPDGSWSDGISLACRNSTIQHNTIIDATDGAIVIFGAPGSLVENNTIIARTRTLLGGINMVDWSPFEGDYTGTTVRGNTIISDGAMIRIGLAMGTWPWWCIGDTMPTNARNRGAIVTDNELRGDQMRYGYAADGVDDWTVMDNRDESTHIGPRGGGCGGTLPPYPTGFLRNPARSSGRFQVEFQSGVLESILWE